MEIGNRLDISIVDIETKYRKSILVCGLAILTVIGIVLFFILNRTHFTEQIIFNKIALLNNFRIESTDEYTILTSRKDDTQIWFRYDEDFEQKKEKRMYATGKYTKANINSEQEILMNLDNMFNPQKQKRLGLPYRGEYEVTFIGDNILRYKSDLPVDDRKTVLEIIETPPIDTTYMVFKDTNMSQLDELNTFCNIKKDDVKSIHWGKLNTLGLLSTKVSINKQKEFSTHTEIVIIEDKGIIFGTCNNSDNTVKELNDIVKELYMISLLEDTSIF